SRQAAPLRRAALMCAISAAPSGPSFTPPRRRGAPASNTTGAGRRRMPEAGGMAGKPAGGTGRPLLEVENLARYFRVLAPWVERLLGGKRPRLLKAVDGVSFAIPLGRTLAIVGESGCGKSTVARLVAGLYRPTLGTIRIDGLDAVRAKDSSQRR